MTAIANWLRVAADFVIGLALQCKTRLFYRIRLVGRDRLPAGPAIVIFNRTSLLDPAIVLSCLGRRAWFYGSTPSRWLPILGPLWAALRGRRPDDPPDRGRADALADAALRSGRLVCLFPEGRMTRLGHMTSFEPEFRGFLDRHPEVPLVPAYIHGTWLSLFSFYRDRLLFKRPCLGRGQATVVVGQPVATSTSFPDIRERVQLAAAEAFDAARYDRLPLHRQFLHNAKRFRRRPCFADTNTPIMNFATAFMRAVILKRLLARKLTEDKFVGVFLPSSVGGALANISLTLHGRIPCNLNYTTGQDVLDSCIRQANIKQVVTSKAFLQRIPLEPNADLIILEDLRKDLRTSDKLLGLAARILPAWFVDRVLLRLGGHSIDDLATIVFSSGSTGEPKGIMLTHHNIVSNAEQTIQHANATERDCVLGILPFFHSFGYTVTMWVPALLGCGSVFHFNPLEAEAVGKLSREYKPTLFFATSTFLRTYIRKCHKDDFASLRMLLCGAEKLQSSVAAEFHAKFGVEPLEGYGCTELSPVVSVNRPDYDDGSVRQIGTKRGSIGYPLPGIAAQIRDVDSLERLPVGSEGLLFIKGPNVMQGYLNKPEMTAEAVRDGWYNTGDIACLDEDGFIRITDRLARFSKIGGEMVPHAKIEEKMHEILNTNEQLCVVVGVPDKRKGERLVVVHSAITMSREDLWHKLRESGMPSLWLPAPNDFYPVEELPVLGTGKLDLKGVKQLARQIIGA